MREETSINVSVEEPAYTMLKAAKILEKSIPNKFTGIKDLASSCNISVSKLKRDFKKAHGITPLEYFRSQQIHYVLDMVDRKQKTLKEIAMDLGFKKTSTFHAWYKTIIHEKEANA